MKDEICALREKLEKTTEELYMKYDELEQHSRRNSIRIIGVHESEDEDIQKATLDVFKKINKDISISDIDRCHRVGKRVQGRSRQIIVKFVSYQDKDGVYTQRRKLRAMMENVFVNEDLTHYSSKLFKMARDLRKSRWIENTWTKDGHIYILEQPDGAVRQIQCKEDLSRYLRK
ncbi:uncharacterized protein [Haliotis asinina]|uniref:uncharacterized protein n=1 Tax=Haliotis asinina TaxID=109174 RepID=UPI00353275AB